MRVSSGLVVSIAVISMAWACSGSNDSVPAPTGGVGPVVGASDAGGSAEDDAGSGNDDTGGDDDGGGVDPGDASDDGGSDDGGSSSCTGATYRVCDGFENAAIDKTTWGLTVKTNATVAVDNVHVVRGRSALHIHTGVSGADTAGTNGSLRTTQGFPFPNNQVWGRTFIYVAKASPDQHTNFIEAVGNLPGNVASHYRLGVTTAHALTGEYTPGDHMDPSKTIMPIDKWSCFEWHFDGAKSEFHVYLDGAELTDMAIAAGHTPAWTAPPFAYVEMGVNLYHDLPNQPTLDVWYDEFALDTQRINCAM